MSHGATEVETVQYGCSNANVMGLITGECIMQLIKCMLSLCVALDINIHKKFKTSQFSFFSVGGHVT